MIKVNSRKCLNNLSIKTLKAAKVRNIVALVAITLTTVLFTALITIGSSMLDTVQQSTFRQVGTSAHAGFKYLTQDQYDKLVKDPKIKDISYNIIIGDGISPKLKDISVEVRYTEKKCAKWTFCMPTKGRLPKRMNEIAVDSIVLDKLGIPKKLGEKFKFEFKTSDGTIYEKEFTLCGIWKGDKAVTFHNVFLSKVYCDKICPVKTIPLYESDKMDYSGTINPELWFDNSWNIEKQVRELKKRCNFDEKVNDGVNWAYSTSNVDFQFIALISICGLLFVMSGYLIIYNIFRISVVNDIQFYGLLKTIGMTGKQLKKLVRKQAVKLCAFGIPLGLIIGYSLGTVLMPIIVVNTNVADGFTISVNPNVFIGSAIFAFLTVMISCIKPCRIASKISPIEAIRYTGIDKLKRRYKRSRTVTPFNMAVSSISRDKKKLILVFSSLSLSLIMINVTFTLVRSFDMNKYVKESSVSDFYITDSSLRSTRHSEPVFDGITMDSVSKVKNLNGVTGVGGLYCTAGFHQFSPAAFNRAIDILKSHKKIISENHAEDDVKFLKQDKLASSFTFGVDPYLWDKIEISKGKLLDKKKFASGKYVIITGFDAPNYNEQYYKTGEEVTIEFNNGKSKKYKVLTFGDIPFSIGPQFSYFIGINFILPADEYCKQMGRTNAMTVVFDAKPSKQKEINEWCKGFTKNSSLTFASREKIKNEFRKMERMYIVIGGTLSTILLLIGLLNFINSIITGINSRKKELATLSSIGMTNKQMKKMLTWEGVFYAIATGIISLTFGSILSHFIAKMLIKDMWFISWNFSVFPIFLMVVILLVICYLVPNIVLEIESRHSLTERLRK